MAVAGRAAEGLRGWGVDEVVEWLRRGLQMPEHVESFQRAQIDGLTLPFLSEASLAELGRSVDATQAELGGLRVSHAAQLQAEREQRTVMYAEMEANMAAEDTVQRLIETLEVEEADAMRERQLEELSHLLTGEYFASHKETLETLGALAERKETELRVKLAQ